MYVNNYFFTNICLLISQLTSMPISAYLLTTPVYISWWIILTLLALYLTAISRQSTPGPRPGFYPSIQSKSQSMLFSRKLNKPAHPQIHMNNIAIEHVESHKHLGISLSSDAKWSKHTSLMLGKAWKHIGMLRSLKYHHDHPCL